jgi:hypothetical protein
LWYFGGISPNVPAVCDGLAARIRKCVAFPGPTNCGCSVAWEWSVAEWPSHTEPPERPKGAEAYTVLLCAVFLLFILHPLSLYNKIIPLFIFDILSIFSSHPLICSFDMINKNFYYANNSIFGKWVLEDNLLLFIVFYL